MTSHESEFRTSPIDPTDIIVDTYADLEAFNQYVGNELRATQLFSAIVRKLSEQRPNEIHSTSDIFAGKVGLEVMDMTGTTPERFTDPNTPMSQDIYYPPVTLPDGNVAILWEDIHHRQGLDSEVVTRIPWLNILSSDALLEFQTGVVDYLSDVSIETYRRSNLDQTGRSEGETPYSEAHRIFFWHPLGQTAQLENEQAKQDLLQDQAAYMNRLQAVSDVVFSEAA